MTTNEILIKARNLIADPNKWYPQTAQRECFCAATAIWAVSAGNEDGDEAQAAGEALSKAAGIKWNRTWRGIWTWNDNAAHAIVIAAFDRAIEATA